jgi:hypothetical protein
MPHKQGDYEQQKDSLFHTQILDLARYLNKPNNLIDWLDIKKAAHPQ